MGRPNASPKQQFQSISQSPAEAIDDRSSAFVDENQQESAGNEQLQVTGDQNGQKNQEESQFQPHQAAISGNRTHQATTTMAFPLQNYQMRSPVGGADPKAFPPQPQAQAFSPTQDDPQSFFHPHPQAFPPSQEEPQAFPPSQDETQSFFPPQPQAFPPSQEEPQDFLPSQQGKPQEFPSKVDDHHHHQSQAFPPAPDEPQAFPARDDYHQPQAFPPAQDDPQPFPPAEGSQHPQVFPPQQATFQQQQQNGMQFPQNANFSHPSTMPASPFRPSSHSMINNATPGFPAINQNPIIQVPTENWKSGLFECMNDPPNALVTACFPCVTFGQIAEIIDSGQTSCGTSGLLYGAIAFCIAMPCLMSCTYRTKLRSRYGLIETPAPDWIIHCFCECCALCQEYRELKERGLDPSIGWIGNVAKQKQIVQNAAMTPPMKQTMMG